MKTSANQKPSRKTEDAHKRRLQRVVRVCRHTATKRRAGPRVPLVWGSAATEVCECGKWRTMHHRPGPWQTRPLSEALKANEE